MFLSYEREAFFAKDGTDFRVTYDDDIICRREEMSLEAGVWGEPLLEDGTVLMELKCSGGMPLWMARLLTQEHLFKTSFSKYGAAYSAIILNDRKEMNTHARLVV